MFIIEENPFLYIYSEVFVSRNEIIDQMVYNIDIKM